MNPPWRCKLAARTLAMECFGFTESTLQQRTHLPNQAHWTCWLNASDSEASKAWREQGSGNATENEETSPGP